MASQRGIAVWLFILCAMVFATVIIGGLTRLTQSGLSMVDWRPLGWLPPVDETQWQALFERYQQFPEYKELNYGMELAEFKSIFWYEYVHRLWGRLMGLVFILPFLYFVIRRRLDRKLVPKLVAIFILGALQGVLGWYMVMSGLVDRPEVSQYRLAAHLAAALVVYGYMFWVALSLLGPRSEESAPTLRPAVPIVLAAWIFITIISGAFVAGLDAGLIHNTFPTMDGEWIPSGLMAEPVWYLNFFEELTTVQFDHRVAALLLVLMVVGFWAAARGQLEAGTSRRLLDGLAFMAIVQAGLGISTLLMLVPIPLAATHQGGALVLFTLVLWLMRESIPRRAATTFGVLQ